MAKAENKQKSQTLLLLLFLIFAKTTLRCLMNLNEHHVSINICKLSAMLTHTFAMSYQTDVAKRLFNLEGLVP